MNMIIHLFMAIMLIDIPMVFLSGILCQFYAHPKCRNKYHLNIILLILSSINYLYLNKFVFGEQTSNILLYAYILAKLVSIITIIAETLISTINIVYKANNESYSDTRIVDLSKYLIDEKEDAALPAKINQEAS